MLKWIWDLLFVRSQWTIISKVEIKELRSTSNEIIGIRYVLQNQWGELKAKFIC